MKYVGIREEVSLMIHYDEYGDSANKTIMFLHAEGLVDSFCNLYYLSDKYHIVVPHLFGSGEEVEEYYTPGKQVKELVKVTEYLGKEDIILVGYSLGAGLAVLLLEACPRYFSKAVFFSPSMCNSRFTTGLLTVKAQIRGLMYKLPAVQKKRAEYFGFDDKQKDKFLEYSKRISFEQYRAWYWNAMNLDECVHFRDVEIPMLSVCAENDEGGIKITAAELARLNPNCVVKLIKNAGRFYPLRKPEEIKYLLEEFLEADIKILPLERNNILV